MWVLPIAIFSSCNSIQLYEVKDPNIPKDVILKVLNDTCMEKTGGRFKAVNIYNLYIDSGAINGMDYDMINNYIVKVEATRDDGYAFCYCEKKFLGIESFQFNEFPSKASIVVDNQNNPVGIDSSVRIIKGKQFFIDTDISGSPLKSFCLIKKEKAWVKADENETSSILNDIEKKKYPDIK